ncbi:MAG: hypothetical protein NVSMB64_33210 [Candidatus Velthaea sp.]
MLNAVFLRPVGAAIAKRRAYINGLATDIEAAESDVKALRGQAEAKRAAARREAEELHAKARAAAQNEAGQVTAGYTQRAAALVADAQREVATEVATARLREDELVKGLAQTLLDRALGPVAA